MPASSAELHRKQLVGQLADLDVMLQRAIETKNGKEASIRARIATYKAELEKADSKPAEPAQPAK